MHVPPALIETVVPVTVQIASLEDVKATVSEEEDVAETVKSAAPYVLLESAAKVIVWVALPKVTVVADEETSL